MGTPHDHAEHVPGCWRCDLSGVEIRLRQIPAVLNVEMTREGPPEPQNATQEPRTALDGTPTPCGCVQALRDEAARHGHVTEVCARMATQAHARRSRVIPPAVTQGDDA